MLDVVLKDIGVEGNFKVGVAERPDGPRSHGDNLLRTFLITSRRAGLSQLLHELLRLFRLQFLRRRRATARPLNTTTTISGGDVTVTLALLHRLLVLALHVHVYHKVSTGWSKTTRSL